MIEELRKLHQASEVLNSRFVERDQEIHGIMLSVLAKTHILLLGPPGTAKSQLVIAWSNLIKDAKYFQWLLTKYTTPEEIFGPYSLAALEKDEYVRKTEHKASEAHFIFFDEIWKANSGVLNANLTLVNERLFYNGAIPVKVPLLTLVGASNELPEEDDNLDAMLDRFLLKYHVKPIIEEQNFMKMLLSKMDNIEPILSLEDIHKLQNFSSKVTMPKEMLELYATLRRDFATNGLISSDRTYRNTIEILKAEALIRYTKDFLEGDRETGKKRSANTFNIKEIIVEEDDFEILRHALWSDPKNESTVYTTILAEINPDKNKVVELFDTARELYEDCMAIKDESKRINTGVEVGLKLKEAKKKIHEFFKTMKNKNKDVADIKVMEEKIGEWLVKIYNDACGVTF
jgi:MoxR-like ATPase